MPDSPGVTMAVCAPLTLVGISAFRDRHAAMEAIEAALGIAPPTVPVRVRHAGVAISCIGPGRWLVSSDECGGFLPMLRTRLAGLAAVTDQSDLWHCVRLWGPLVRDSLVKCLPVDVDPSRFRPGDLALTRAGHLDLRVWHLEDEDGFEVAVARSYADNLTAMLRLCCEAGAATTTRVRP